MITITLNDGSKREYSKGTSLKEIAKDISSKLAKNAVVAVFNDELIDLNTPIFHDGQLEILDFSDDRAKEVYRHSSAHVMAQAVKRLWPESKLAIGPPIDKGYYYDFDSNHTFSPDDLNIIEKEMNKIIKENIPFIRKELSKQEAIKFFKECNEDYKVELIEELPEDEVISIYEQSEFVDLCAGPHVPTTGKLKAIKLMNLAGAYWRGDEQRKMLQRIYGTSFPKKEMLDDHLFKLEEAKKRDHRKLGKELGLFVVLEEGPGFPFFLPKGMILRNELEKFWRDEHEKAGYEEIRTPIILNRELWEKSGHWDHYKENMYFTNIDDNDFAIKPMNCPGGILVYKQNLYSYKDLPLRTGEMGLVHRHEKSGVLHGLMRVRAFTQDDAHIFMLPNQIIDEIKAVIDIIDHFYSLFGFPYHVELSTRPEDSMGSDEIWDFAIGSLRQALDEKGIDYKVNEGDGAFYGPKIDFHLQDSLDRTWQCGTIQLDFQFPEKFDLTYVGEDGERHRPVMIHRVVYGSIERFIGILTEHYGGAFPTWLAPVQARILPITDKHHDYAQKVYEELKAEGIRVEVDSRSEKTGYKIREGQLMKIPYLLIVGDKEIESEAVAVRKRKEGDLGAINIKEFKARIKDEIANKTS
ncbi:Threonyl-tRNA synthetase [Candidatus Syntrophocurvum alkaliphilum]|uniref:Threonine--tRNA ligase n=1 Tax=Candidatus Syntrophocurvum alkaliphilum TaxID=2293317 RepID=A0A6I6DK54_9FIRM|nr:threonine--tRNA ligase [Candidatus Syntrophocurvum alkaliphilum]QGT99721.1 Threonyl-tRNA synthetase [Candidatus Syntrophocurvum alkaliphilum]